MGKKRKKANQVPLSTIFKCIDRSVNILERYVKKKGVTTFDERTFCEGCEDELSPLAYAVYIEEYEAAAVLIEKGSRKTERVDFIHPVQGHGAGTW